MVDEKERFTRSNCKSGDESLHGAKTKVGVESELFEEHVVQVGVHRGSVLSPLLFAIAVDVVMENP